jgi:hypothetical protein
MRVVVVFESMYGNTHAVADEIATGLAGLGEVVVGSTDQIPPSTFHGNLLVVGGPTHVHGMSSNSSRHAAAEAADADPELDLDENANAPGLRSWLKQLPDGKDIAAAAYDTRIDQPTLITGSAAKGIAKRLRRHGYALAGDPMSFLVADSGGPLVAGELERARAWGEHLATRLAAGAPVVE